MGFAGWKKRSALFVDAWAGNTHLINRIERACAAAYKAGERDGRKQVEAVAEQVIKLRELMHSSQPCTTKEPT